MPYKEKNRNGKWRARVKRQGKTKTQLFNTKAEAVLWEAQQKSLPSEKFWNETDTVSSLAEWAEAYMDHAKAKFSSKTYAEKRVAFQQFFKSVSPKLEPSGIHPGTVLKHFAWQAKERSGNAANKDRKNLIAAWNWAVKYLPGWSKDNPFAQTDRQDGEQHPRYVPPVEDFWAVYDSVSGQDQVMLFTYLHTAARRGELFELTWEDVDFDGARIRLWTRKRKGGRECDWVPMTGELHDMLSWWYENRTFRDSSHVFLCESKAPFSQEVYGKPFVTRQKWMRGLCEKAGVKPFGIHAIRHLSASILDDAGYPITVIQALLRHKSANTTAKYLHNLRGMKVVLDDAFKRKSRPTAPARAEGRPLLRLVKSAG